MKLDEFLNMCTSRDWPELISFLQSDVKDLSTKIFVSAVIQEHHSEETTAKKYSLNSCWSKKLSARPVPPLLSIMSSAVDLGDFAGAYLLAKSENLNDEQAASAIADFVRANKSQLGQFLKSDNVPEDQKNLIIQLFGDLLITKEQKEAYFKRNFAQQAKQKISFLQAVDQVNIDIAKIFGLAQSDFHVTFHRKSNMEGIDSDSLSSEGDISFNKVISNNLIKTLVEALKNIDISSNYYNMSLYAGRKNARGIQLWLTPEDMHKKLATYSTFSKDQNNSPSDNTQRFFKVAELAKEIKVLADEEHTNKLKK